MAVHAHLFFAPVQVLYTGNDGLISVFIKTYLVDLNPTLLFVIYQLVVLLQAVRINSMLDEYRMFPQAGYTAAMGYVLLTALFKDWSTISSALMANFILIWLFMKVVRLYNQQSPKTLLFNIGLIMGMAIIAYHPIAIMIPILLFSLAIMRAFQLQEWFVLLMGTLLPFYFLVSWLYINDSTSSFITYLPKFYLNKHLFPIHNKQLITGSIVFAFSVLIGIFYWQQFNSRLVIQMRKNWSVLLLTLLIVVLAPFIFWQAGISCFLLTIVPAAAFLGAAFSHPKSLLFPNLLFWLLVAIIVWNNLLLIS
jgi:hypothetical protein